MKKLIMVMAVACCLVFGCTHLSTVPSSDQAFLYFERADIHSLVEYDPAALARDDLAKRKPRFLGVLGFALAVPGIDSDSCSAIRFHIYIIGGTTDMGGDYSAQERAIEFSRQYNLIVREYLVRHKMLESFVDCEKKYKQSRARTF